MRRLSGYTLTGSEAGRGTVGGREAWLEGARHGWRVGGMVGGREAWLEGGVSLVPDNDVDEDGGDLAHLWSVGSRRRR